MIGIKFILICFFTVKSVCQNNFTVLDSDEQGNIIWPWALPQSYIKQHGITKHMQGYNPLMRTELQNDQTSQETVIISTEKEIEPEGNDYYKVLNSYEDEDNYQEQSPNKAESRRRNDFGKEHQRGTKIDDNFVTDDKTMSSSVERKKPGEGSHKSNLYSEEIKTDPHAYCDAGKKQHMQKGNTKLKDSYRKKMKTPLYQQMQKGDTQLKDDTPNAFENPEIPPQSNNISYRKKMTKRLSEQMQKGGTTFKDNTTNFFEHPENPHSEPHSYNTLYRNKMTKLQHAKISMENITNKNAIRSLKKPKTDIKISSNNTENMEIKPESDNHKESFEDGNQNQPTSESINESTGSTMIEPRNPSVEVGNQNLGIRAYESESQEAKRLEALDYLGYPYSVSIQRKGAHYASGALVGKRWVLTTAQEFYNVGETIRLFRMRLGSIDCKKGGILIPIKRITVHPNFTPGQPAFDVSILVSPEPIPLSPTVQPIGISRIADAGMIENMKFLKFTITYWPRIVMKQGVIPDSATERVMFNIMRVSSQTLIPTAACVKHMAAVDVQLDNNSMCLKPVKNFHSECMADVGAPMISVDGLWGITSGWVSPLCPTVPQTVILTRVSSSTLHAWIEATMTKA